MNFSISGSMKNDLFCYIWRNEKIIFACFRLVFRVYLNTYFCISSDPPFIFYFLYNKSQSNILELLYNPFSNHS